MLPTPKLRFVWHEVEMVKGQPPLRVRVLQQWWAPEDVTGNEIRLELRGEWRDVATEKENV